MTNSRCPLRETWLYKQCLQAEVWVYDIYDLHVYCLAYPIRSQDTIIVILLDPVFSRRLFDSTLISLRAGSLMRVRWKVFRGGASIQRGKVSILLAYGTDELTCPRFFLKEFPTLKHSSKANRKHDLSQHGGNLSNSYPPQPLLPPPPHRSNFPIYRSSCARTDSPHAWVSDDFVLNEVPVSWFSYFGKRNVKLLSKHWVFLIITWLCFQDTAFTRRTRQ